MNLSESIERGLHYVLGNQSDSGYWSDWQLPPGESKVWTTAYIGYRLASLPTRQVSFVKQTCLNRAQDWLRAAEARDGGWGYGEQTESDADSTSLALLFLNSQGSDDDSDCALGRFQQPDGGFSTYTRDTSYGSWTESHPDVTAVALNALLRSSSRETKRIAAGVRYLQEQQRADGLWNSFWWISNLYATEAAIAIVQLTGECPRSSQLRSSLLKITATNVFECALQLLCLVRSGNVRVRLTLELAGRLAQEQLSDGSWPSRPILRLTSRHITEPWVARDAGPLFGDPRRLFTSTTVIAALAAYENELSYR